MALEAKRAAYNTAVDAMTAALDDLLDGLNAGDVVMFLPIDVNPGVASTSATKGFAATSVLQERVSYVVPGAAGNNNNKYAIQDPGGALALMLGRLPLAWKTTNDAGEIA